MVTAPQAVRPEREWEFSVLERLRARDAAVMSELYERYGRIIRAAALRITGDEGVSEDLVQEIFLRVWTQPGLFQPERGSFSGWLNSVARNRAIDYLRSTEGKLSRSRTGIDTSHANEPPARGALYDFQLMPPVVRAMQALPAHQREVIRLTYYEGMSQSEMASSMNRPLGTVKTWARSALATLRREVVDLPRVRQAEAVASPF